VRLLFSVCLVSCGCAALLGLALATPLLAAVGAPAWMAYVLGGFTFASVCVALGSFSVTLGLLAQRNSLDFIPARDYAFFVEGVCKLPAGIDVQPLPLEEWRSRTPVASRPENQLLP